MELQVTVSWFNQLQAELQIDGLVQDCSNSIANALELLQSCTKPSKYWFHQPATVKPLV